MPYVASIGTYLPCWGAPQHRVAGDDEDAITLAVEAGRAALIAGGGMSEACERIISAECAGQACEVGA
jgi:3-hydroxy-3-methylglutaryl CoA synthase